MSNRVLAVLVLFWVIMGFVLLYLYFFVHYTGSIVIQSNVAWYQTELYAKGIAQRRSYDCPESECHLRDIPPLDYSITLTKTGYTSYHGSIDLGRQEEYLLEVELEKQVQLIIQETEATPLSTKEKIAQIKKKKRYAYYQSYTDIGEIIIDRTGEGSVLLYQWDTLLASFGKSLWATTLLQRVEGSTSYILVTIWEEKYLYHLGLRRYVTLDLKVLTNYIKITSDDQYLLFVTDKWVFRYDTIADGFEFQGVFDDFVYVDDYYIGVIREGDPKRIQEYGLDEGSQSYIVSYNPSTKEQKFIYGLDQKVEKILYIDGVLQLENSQGERYVLENYR